MSTQTHLTPVHLVAGFLGSGKTTLLMRELERRGRATPEGPGERCAVIVNDFGQAQIDRQLLGGAVGIKDISGGCMCCTAPADLVPSISAIIEELKPDRIFIEPSGLGRPQDILDMLSRGATRKIIALQPTVVLVDPMAVRLAHPLLMEQVEGADILVASRCDLATAEAMEAFTELAAGLWPQPLRVLQMQNGFLPTNTWEWPEDAGLRLTSPVMQRGPSTDGFSSISLVLPPSTRFDWTRTQAWLATFPTLVRFKAILNTDSGWLRLDKVREQLHLRTSALRRDNRVDAIFMGDVPDGFKDGLLACQGAAESQPGDQVAVVDADGFGLYLGIPGLLSLPGQIEDVSTLVPGREGRGVRLQEILALTGAGPDQRFVVTASDGMVSEARAIAEVEDGILVYQHQGGPLPARLGGPFRLLAPAQSKCANVKGVVRIRVLPGGV